MGSTNPFKDQSFSLTKKLLPWTLYALLPIALLRLFFYPIPFLPSPETELPHSSPITITSHSSSSPSPSSSTEKEKTFDTPCDYFNGKWVRDRRGPLYNGTTCGTIKEGQNCITHGRPDSGYLYWRWKPSQCHLPRFEPHTFLQLIKNKHIAFVGDSMARNQLESLLCMLATVSTPNLVYKNGEDNKFRRWHFPSHNASVSVYWSPFLVQGVEKSNSGPNHNKLYLDLVDERWGRDMDQMDLLVLSVGHWFLHPAVYYEGDSVLGCHYCPDLNHTEIGFYDVLRKALRTTLNSIIDRRGYKGNNGIDVVVTTFSPAHFEGEWDKAGACLSFRYSTYMLLIAFLIWSSNFEACVARRGKHWRQNRAATASMLKSSGHNNQHGGGSKPKPPSHKTTQPLPKAPKHKSTPSSPQIPPPQEDNPSTQPPKAYNGRYSTTFNVLDFGAKGDGNTDDTKAFQSAWAEACKVEASTMLVPADYVFFVGPIAFSGPYCKPNIVFQLDGTIVAPTNPNFWGGGLFQWLDFTKLVGITIQGNGIIDGRGSVWWQDHPFDNPIDDEEKLLVPLNHTVGRPPMQIQSQLGRKMPYIKPTALRFYGSINPTVTGITIQNSPQCHLKFDNCNGVLVHDVTVSSPGDSPNTDGIHLQNSKDVLIHSSTLACGDDCISIQTGCSNVYVHNVNCGPGHGISIGSLGKDNTRACVSNITVRDVNMHNTMNGVRIKTWQGGSGSVQGVLFSNIQVSEVQLPIVIDQFYCDKRTCSNQTSAVALAGINYERIRGTYTVKPVHFACSDSLPCVDVSLTTVQLEPVQEQYHLYDPFCWKAYGELKTPTVPPIACLQIGKPPNNRIQTNHDLC